MPRASHFRRRTARRLGIVTGVSMVLGLLGVGLSPLAHAGDECTSTQAANALLHCEHCKAVKKLLTQAAIHDVSIAVHDLEHGVVVQLEGKSPEAIDLVHSLADEMWTTGRHCETEISTACHERFDALSHVGIDRALTDDGVILVLSSQNEELVAWVRDDARMTRSFVMSAASAD